MKKLYAVIPLLLTICALRSPVIAQEFPIAVGSDSTFASGGAFDGTNYLVAIQGDSVNSNSVTAQLVSTSGQLIGPRISLGMLVAPDGVIAAAFDGSDYLMTWSDAANTVYGQFISTSGAPVRSPFVIATNATMNERGGCLAFGDTTFMVVWTRASIHYGQRVSTSGNLIGAPTQISSTLARDNCIAFDGTNYLVAWCDHVNDDLIYGQFISASGALVGSNFVIDGSTLPSDNPVSIAFDGSRYLVCFHDQAGPNSSKWNLFARFVDPAGAVSGLMTICDSTSNPIFPMIACDGTKYLITWTEGESYAAGHSKGRYFSKTGTPLGAAFALFDTLQGKVPLLSAPVCGGNQFAVVTTRIRLNVDPGSGNIQFTDGDVYGMILPPGAADVREEPSSLTPRSFSLAQNYPNPFNPTTTIEYTIGGIIASTSVRLVVYDILGREVAMLVNGRKEPGRYQIDFDGSKLGSGVYFCRLTAGQYVETRKMLLMK